jgi:hypothetical protein
VIMIFFLLPSRRLNNIRKEETCQVSCGEMGKWEE